MRKRSKPNIKDEMKAGGHVQIQNPVIAGFHPDPSVCHANGKYYLATSSFEFYPGVPLFESEDLVNWAQIGHCLRNPEQARLQDAPPSGGIWAPSIRWNEGLFYMCTTNKGGGGNFFVTAKNPAGKWSEPVHIDMKSIDPCLFFEDEKMFCLTPQTKTKGAVRGIYMAQIDPKNGQKQGEEHLLWQGSGGKCLEAPRLYRIGEYYYLLAAEGGTEYGHCITVARSKHLLGPYKGCESNPIVTSRNDHDNPLQCTGHGELIQAPDGSWAMMLLASRRSSKWYSHLGRETCLAPVVWRDGWPVLAQGGKVVRQQQEIPWLARPQIPQEGFCYDFAAPEWEHTLNFVRRPKWDNYYRNVKAHRLVLQGGTPIEEMGCPTFVGHRQQWMNCEVAVELGCEPVPGGSAGLVAYVSEDYHYAIAVAQRQGVPVLELRVILGRSIRYIVATVALPATALTLMLRATRGHYHFGHLDAEGVFRLLGSLETKFLSNEVAKAFTGVHFGLFCCGGESKQTAAFSRFCCHVLPEENEPE